MNDILLSREIIDSYWFSTCLHDNLPVFKIKKSCYPIEFNFLKDWFKDIGYFLDLSCVNINFN